MGARQLIILSVAAIAAVCLALVMAMTMKHKAAPVVVMSDSSAHAMVQVLVAKRDLPIGTRLAAGDLAWQPWPVTALNSAYITDGRGGQTVPVTPAAVVASQAGQVANAAAASMAGGGPMEALYGAMVRTAMIANEPVVSSKLLRAGEGGYMAVVLGPGMRAVSIPVTVTTAGGGFILPGDHVDLLQARRNDPSANGGHPPANGLDFTVSEVLRNVRVLAIDQSVAPAKGSESIVGAVATLEVPDGDTKAVAAAKAQGEITLVLRPFGDNSGPTAPRAVSTGSVRLFRGGEVSEVAVAQ